MKRPAPAPGSPADVAGEFRLHQIRAELAAPRFQRNIDPPWGERALVLRGTPLGDLDAWIRPDPAHFFDPAGYPGELVPVVDVDLWEAAAPHPRLLLVVSTVTRAMLVCSPRRTYTSWVRRSVDGPRGYLPAMHCPKGQLKTFGWLKNKLV